MNLSVIEQYIEIGNFQDLDLLLLKNPDLVTEKTSHGISPLLLACYYNKPQIIQVILKHTKTITIHEACAVGLKDHVQMMIDYDKNIVNEISNQGFTPLCISAHFNKEEITSLLLAHHADPNIPSQNEYQVYPLHAALNSDNSSISKMLMEAGAKVNTKQYGQISPLHIAAQHGNIDMLISLLEEGADVSSKTSRGETASDLAAEKGFDEIAEILKVN